MGEAFICRRGGGGGIVIPNPLLPELVCATPHLRDLVWDDGVLCVRIGFFTETSFSITAPLIATKLILVGEGGPGGWSSPGTVGAGGGAGEVVTNQNVPLPADSYSVRGVGRGFQAITELYRATTKLYQAGPGYWGEEIESGIANVGGRGQDGVHLNILYGPIGGTPRTMDDYGEGGFGFGAGGGGAGNPAGNAYDHGEPGSGAIGCVVLYFPL